MGFPIYGEIYNLTYFNMMEPQAHDPVHGSWKEKPKAIPAGGKTTYELENGFMTGSEAEFGNDDDFIKYSWLVRNPKIGENFVQEGFNENNVLLAYRAATGSGAEKFNSPNFTYPVPPRGSPVAIRHYIYHNPRYLIPSELFQKQQTDNWCWAACISILYSYYRGSGSNAGMTQAHLANDRWRIANEEIKYKKPEDNLYRDVPYVSCQVPTLIGNETDAAIPKIHKFCDEGASTDETVLLMRRLGLTPSLNYKTSPSEAFLINELNSSHPVYLMRQTRTKDNNHAQIIFGYFEENSKIKFRVFDPGYSTLEKQVLIKTAEELNSRSYIETAYPEPWKASGLYIPDFMALTPAPPDYPGFSNVHGKPIK